MKEVMGTEHFTLFIKDLLSLEKNSTYTIQTMEERFQVRFVGNSLKVKKDLYKWIKEVML